MFLQESSTLLHQRGSSEWQWVQLGNSKASDSVNYTKVTTGQDKKPTQTETSKTNGPAKLSFKRNPFGPEAKCKQNRPKDKALKWKTVCLHYQPRRAHYLCAPFSYFFTIPCRGEVWRDCGEVAWTVNFLQVRPIKYLNFLLMGIYWSLKLILNGGLCPHVKFFSTKLKRKKRPHLINYKYVLHYVERSLYSHSLPNWGINKFPADLCTLEVANGNVSAHTHTHTPVHSHLA